MSSSLKNLSISIKIHVVKPLWSLFASFKIVDLWTESVGSRRELVANCVHTTDATQLDSFVTSASAVCIGHKSRHIAINIIIVIIVLVRGKARHDNRGAGHFGHKTFRHQDTLGHFGTTKLVLKFKTNHRWSCVSSELTWVEVSRLFLDHGTRVEVYHVFSVEVLEIGAEVSQSVVMPKCLVAEVSGNRQQ